MVAKSKKSVAAAKPARKVAAKPAVKPVVKPAAVTTNAVGVTPEQRKRMIEISAYYIAEKNGFKGDAQKYWFQAEQEVDAKLGKK